MWPSCKRAAAATGDRPTELAAALSNVALLPCFINTYQNLNIPQIKFKRGFEVMPVSNPLLLSGIYDDDDQTFHPPVKVEIYETGQVIMGVRTEPITFSLQ